MLHVSPTEFNVMCLTMLKHEYYEDPTYNFFCILPQFPSLQAKCSQHFVIR